MAKETLTKLQQERDLLSARVEALSSLIEVGIIINSTFHLDEVMQLVMKKAQQVMQAEASSILLINREKKVFECPVALGEAGEKFKTIEIPLDRGIAGWVASHQQAQIIPDAYRDDRFNPDVDRKTGFRTRSILAAPLKVRDRLIGVAEVINRKDGKAFDTDDLKLFSAFCRQVAMAIENARIHQLELERQRIAQQLEAARHIQQSFMPETFPVSPEGRFTLAAKSLAAAEVGGDLFDFVEIDAGRLGVSIGDVSGKGIPAALYMARLVSDFRLHAQSAPQPARLLETLNRALVPRSRRGMFVTFLYGVLDGASGRFSFANAGHLPPLRIAANGRIELLEEGGGIPLGITAGAAYGEQTVELNPGDYLVLVTDGVVEAHNPDGAMYSYERLQALLAAPVAGPEALLERLLDDVNTFSAGAPRHDDITAVVLKWEG